MSEKINKRTSEEIARIEESRTLSDADFLSGGGEYVANEDGKINLLTTAKQIHEKEEEMYANFKHKGTLDQQREAYDRKLLTGAPAVSFYGSAKYIQNEKGEKQLIPTENQIREMRDEMEEYFLENVSPEQQKEIIDFVNAPGELEKLKFLDTSSFIEHGRGLRPYSIRSIASEAGAKKGESFIFAGYGNGRFLVYKGEIPVQVPECSEADCEVQRTKENCIKLLRERYKPDTKSLDYY